MKDIIRISLFAALVWSLPGEVLAQEKPWTLSGKFRGFYDDNIATTPTSPLPGSTGPQQSYGFEVIPRLELEWIQPGTELTFSYEYGMRYYENRSNSADHRHMAELKLEHAFTESYSVTVQDSFTVAQEAALLAPGGAPGTPLRTLGNNMVNDFETSFLAELSDLFSVELLYGNGYFDFEQTGLGSRSALLDRWVNRGQVNLRWQALQDTLLFVGYQYEDVNMFSKDLIAPGTSASIRDRQAHYTYLGVDRLLTRQWTLSARGGVQYTLYPNAPATVSDNQVSPYVDLSTTYGYGENRAINVGLRHTRTSTDVAGVTTPTLDTETTSVYATVDHAITAKLSCSLFAQSNFSEFNQGVNDGAWENLYMLGSNLSYAFSQFVAMEVGYSFDRLDSDIQQPVQRSFTRNRVFLGVNVSY